MNVHVRNRNCRRQSRRQFLAPRSRTSLAMERTCARGSGYWTNVAVTPKTDATSELPVNVPVNVRPQFGTAASTNVIVLTLDDHVPVHDRVDVVITPPRFCCSDTALLNVLF